MALTTPSSALNDQEYFRSGSGAQAHSSNIDSRTFHETALWPFAEPVHVGSGAVMCVYNRVNQTGACRNPALLNEVLKEELDFQGFVVSDWGAVEDLEGSVGSGVDVNMPGGCCAPFYNSYTFTHLFLLPQDIRHVSHPVAVGACIS